MQSVVTRVVKGDDRRWAVGHSIRPQAYNRSDGLAVRILDVVIHVDRGWHIAVEVWADQHHLLARGLAGQVDETASALIRCHVGGHLSYGPSRQIEAAHSQHGIGVVRGSRADCERKPVGTRGDQRGPPSREGERDAGRNQAVGEHAPADGCGQIKHLLTLCLGHLAIEVVYADEVADHPHTQPGRLKGYGLQVVQLGIDDGLHQPLHQ
mmetsp:Transcript_8238/g.23650  ORF Transcript_8238/g.23650 Transcript_8238/m.23650 type:complete len:209 (+) Transcript_8238:932-1558(+)